MNVDDPLSYLPVQDVLMLKNHPKKISDPKAVAAESGVLLSKPKAPSLFTMRILVRSTSGDWDIRDMKCQIWGEALKKGCSSLSLQTTTIITTNATTKTLNACGENLGQGKFQATHFLVDNPTLSGWLCSFLQCLHAIQVCAYERYPHALFSRHFLKHQPHVGGVVGTTEDRIDFIFYCQLNLCGYAAVIINHHY